MTRAACPPGLSLIRLSNGEYAVVDEEDAAELSLLSWHVGDRGYVVHNMGVDGRTIQLLMHHVVMRAAPGELVDHWDGNRLHNWKANLRKATKTQNAWNRGLVAGRAYKGTYEADGRWKARIKIDGRTIYLGSYPTEEMAALVYDEAAREFFGEFARLNFPSSRP
jgi:hypothetical protein